MQAGDYAVLPTCIRDENCLINYLKRNGFKYEKHFENDPLDRGYVIVINVIHRIYFRIDKYYLSSSLRLSEKEFLDKINMTNTPYTKNYIPIMMNWFMKDIPYLTNLMGLEQLTIQMETNTKKEYLAGKDWLRERNSIPMGKSNLKEPNLWTVAMGLIILYGAIYIMKREIWCFQVNLNMWEVVLDSLWWDIQGINLKRKISLNLNISYK